MLGQLRAELFGERFTVRIAAPVESALLTPGMFVGDVIAGHGTTPFIAAAQAAGCNTANGDDMVEAVQDLMADFMLGN